MKKICIFSASLISFQALAFSQSEISGSWECMSPGQTYTMMIGNDGSFESHQGNGGNYVGSYSIEENFLRINAHNTSDQPSSLGNSYTVVRLGEGQMVLAADGQMISCNRQ